MSIYMDDPSKVKEKRTADVLLGCNCCLISMKKRKLYVIYLYSHNKVIWSKGKCSVGISWSYGSHCNVEDTVKKSLKYGMLLVVQDFAKCNNS